jgi:hypothetical protein
MSLTRVVPWWFPGPLPAESGRWMTGGAGTPESVRMRYTRTGRAIFFSCCSPAFSKTMSSLRRPGPLKKNGAGAQKLGCAEAADEAD